MTTLVSPERKYWIATALFVLLVSVALIVSKGLGAGAMSTTLCVTAFGSAAVLVVAVRARLEVADGSLRDCLWPLPSQVVDLAAIDSVSVGRAPSLWPGMLLIATLHDGSELTLRSTTAYLLLPSRAAMSELAAQL